ncbi:MAG: cellulose synthase/poly-beta-1,6-N-acetylglucosamine synthase-like glycosyltransferase [Verrucomicrobiales bacterium]|jgi:cellulose synthase/poly-beta-1,6-N-acetylglucosamine synthase-like glycosyltransferase
MVLLGLSLLWLPHVAYGILKGFISIVMLIKQNRWIERASTEFPRRKVALIVAAKGVSETFEEFLGLILHQDYGEDRYRVIFVTESESDPARLAFDAYVRNPESKIAVEITCVVAGESVDEGQKVHNQLAAFKELREDDQIVAFADADIADQANWLTRLVTPLNAGQADGTTGYRWFLPQTRSLANLVATTLNAGIAILAGPRWKTILWGGSMALSRETFDEIEVPKLLRGSLNDDVQITHFARKAGKRLTFIRSLMAASPVDYTWSALFEFGRRQYFQVRIYSPAFWKTGFGFTTTYLIGAVASFVLALSGDCRGWIVLGAVALMNFIRWILRYFYLRIQFPPEIRQQLLASRILELFTATLIFVPHWLIIMSSTFIREITWAGIRYRVTGRQKVEVIGRKK